MAIFKTTIRFIGFTLLSVFILLSLSVLVAFINRSDGSFYPLLNSSGITLVAGLSCVLFTKPQKKIDPGAGHFIVTGCWLAACFFGALPFALYKHEFSVVNAFLRAFQVLPPPGRPS